MKNQHKDNIPIQQIEKTISKTFETKDQKPVTTFSTPLCWFLFWATVVNTKTCFIYFFDFQD